MSPSHCDPDQRARSVAERIERMHDWIEKQRDGRKFEVYVEPSGRVVWDWERTDPRAVSAGTFTNRIGLAEFRDCIYIAYDQRRVA